jgi:hypothetical protein
MTDRVAFDAAIKPLYEMRGPERLTVGSALIYMACKRHGAGGPIKRGDPQSIRTVLGGPNFTAALERTYAVAASYPWGATREQLWRTCLESAREYVDSVRSSGASDALVSAGLRRLVTTWEDSSHMLFLESHGVSFPWPRGAGDKILGLLLPGKVTASEEDLHDVAIFEADDFADA